MAALSWDDVAASVEFTLKIDARQFRKRVPLCCRVLDYGCGYGRVTRLLTSMGYEAVIGYDISEAMLARGRREHPTLTLLPCGKEGIPEADSSFDAVVGCGVLNSVVDPEMATTVAAELTRVLRPGGILHLAEFMVQPGRSYRPGHVTYSTLGVPIRHWTEEVLEKQFPDLEALSLSIVPARTIAGSPAPALQFFARKMAIS